MIEGDGNALWAWQSEDKPGTWSLIAMGIISVIPPQAMVLVHRRREIVEGMRPLALAHQASFHQRVRMVQFEIAHEAETIDP